MAHKTQLEGTVRQLTGGKVLVDGTAYAVKSGKTLVDGTVQTIGFSSEVYTLTTDYGSTTPPSKGSGSITYNGETYTVDTNGIGPYQIEVAQGDSVTISLTGRDRYYELAGSKPIKVTLNGTVVASEKTGIDETTLEYTYTPQANATIKFVFGYANGYYYSQATITEAG